MRMDMPSSRKLRTFAAKATLALRKTREHFSRPDAIDQLMASLPVVATETSLRESVVLITGAGQGVGRVLALALSERGAKVCLMGRQAETLNSVLSEIPAANGKAIVQTGDIARSDDIARVLDQIEQQLGPLTHLVNNAGVGGPWGMPFWEAPEEDFVTALDINLTGSFRMARAAAARAVAAGRGIRIVNVTSIATEMPMSGIAAYTTSKSGVEALTSAMAQDGAGKGVVAVAVSLNSVQTERKAAHDWASNALLPPAETVVPAFLHALTAPADQVQGRCIAAWRFAAAPFAETLLAGPAAAIKPIAYPPFLHKGQQVDRDPVRFRINDRAENPWGPSPHVAETIAEEMARLPLSYYPEERHDRLIDALSAHHGLAPGCFAVGPGSWELLSRLVRLFAKPGEEIVSNAPGWFGFNLVAQRAGVRLSMAPFHIAEAGLGSHHNLAGLAARVTPMTRLVYLIHPANPEGVPLRQAEMDDFLAALPRGLPVIVDEAYLEYAEGPDLFDTRAAVARGDRLVIGLRTFSKFYALAGARVGYAYARPDLIALVRNAEHIFGIASLSEAAAVAALSDTAHITTVRTAFLAERARMTKALQGLGLAPLPSQAPFVLCLRPDRMDHAHDKLEAEGIYLARYSFHADRYMMVPVARAETNDRILSVLAEMRG